MASEAFSNLVESIRSDLEDCLATLSEMRGSDRNSVRSSAVWQLYGLAFHAAHTSQFLRHCKDRKDCLTDEIDGYDRLQFDVDLEEHERLTIKQYEEMKANAGKVQ